MSNKLMKITIDAIGICLIAFLNFIIVHKVFFYMEDWLSFSIMWSVSVGLGRFLSQIIATWKKGGIWFIIINVVILITVFLLGVFVMNALLKVFFPFAIGVGLSLITNQSA